MTFMTRLCTLFTGKKVGCDEFGNTYYVEKNPSAGKKPKRWVIYLGDSEATKIPPDWHGWMHYTVDQPPPSTGLPTKKPWIKKYQSNATGTAQAYLPRGHILRHQPRAKATGDYEPWNPS